MNCLFLKSAAENALVDGQHDRQMGAEVRSYLQEGLALVERFPDKLISARLRIP